MAKHDLLAGTTSYICHVLALSTVTSRGATGLTASQCSLSYMRIGASAAVAVPVVAISTLGVYAGSATQAAFGEVRTAAVPNNSGLYELHLPNNGVAAGARAVTFWLSDIGNSDVWVASPIEFQFVAADPTTELFEVTETEITAVPAYPVKRRDILRWLVALARNKRTSTATTEALRNDADAGNISTNAHSDDGVTAIRGEWS